MLRPRPPTPTGPRDIGRGGWGTGLCDPWHLGPAEVAAVRIHAGCAGVAYASEAIHILLDLPAVHLLVVGRPLLAFEAQELAEDVVAQRLPHHLVILQAVERM